MTFLLEISDSDENDYIFEHLVHETSACAKHKNTNISYTCNISLVIAIDIIDTEISKNYK